MPYVPQLKRWEVRCRERRVHLDRAVDALREFCSTQPEIRAVYAFGSYAGGDVGPESDLDLLVVYASEQHRTAVEDRLRRLFPLDVTYDLILVTPQAHAERLKTTSFGCTILASSRQLYAV